MKIYLAGKISKNCWRHSLVKGLRDQFEGGCGESMSMIEEWWPVLQNAIGDGLHYCGPYFISCDHGCFHSEEASHGAVASYESMSHDENSYSDEQYSRAYSRCLGAIEVSDVVFCWIESDDCFGTIAEIGYAKAMGKFICISFAESFDAEDMWFVRSMADCTFSSRHAESAFEQFKKRYCDNKNKEVRFLF